MVSIPQSEFCPLGLTLAGLGVFPTSGEILVLFRLFDPLMCHHFPTFAL